MSWLNKIFGTKRAFTGNFIQTGEELLALISSNPVVSAEYDEFASSISQLTNREDIEEKAIKSADALSGYGISVTPQAFIELTK